MRRQIAKAMTGTNSAVSDSSGLPGLNPLRWNCMASLASPDAIVRTEAHRLALIPSVKLGVDSAIDGLAKRPADDCRSMTAHQNDVVAPAAVRQSSSKFRIADQEIGGGACGVPNFEQRRFLADEAGHMEDRTKASRLGNAERHDRVGMAVNDRHRVGTRAIDLRVDETLEVDRRSIGFHCCSVEVEFQDVVLGDLSWSHVASQQEPGWVLIVADTDVAESIDYALVEQNVVGDDEIGEQFVARPLVRGSRFRQRGASG